MPLLRLNIAAPDFAEQFKALLNHQRAVVEDVSTKVSAILRDVRTRGDDALRDLTKRFDRVQLTDLRFSTAEIAAARAACPADTLAALEIAAERIRAYHLRQKPTDDRYMDTAGISLGHRWTAIGAVGIYVPGGTASYPSSVLMNAIPANVAGTPRIVMCVPTPDGKINPAVLAAADLAGVTEIYRIGGAQAVAAMAYGTATIAAVDKITGPGNAWVAEAKRQVFGTVGIDMVAGPSEILVLADAQNDPYWIAADLLSQAEHDNEAQSILITDTNDFADNVAQAVEITLKSLPRSEIAGQSWHENGAIIVIDDLGKAGPLIDALAPEHLELAVEDAEALLPTFRNAGSIFLGRHTPEAIGDYVGGPNHVLPTARSARFSSGLSVLDFMKRSSLISCSRELLAIIGPVAVTLAKAEGLQAHGLSVSVRLKT